MNNFSIIKVNSAAERAMFSDAARFIYSDDDEWVCVPDRMLENIFNSEKNPSYDDGSASRWILTDGEKPVGRIAAFYNERKLNGHAHRIGQIGFFECINDVNGSRLLFEAAVNWLKSININGVEGPVNFGENDRFWGLLVEGFTSPPFTTNYNKAYYQKLFEDFGFQVYYQMFSNEINLNNEMPERFRKISEWLVTKSDIEVRHVNKSNLHEFASYFLQIYNDAWQYHDGFTPMTLKQAKRFADEMKHVVIDNMCPFAFVRGEPAGFIIAVPDLNQIFKQFEGKINLFQQLLFKWKSRNNYKWYIDNGMLNRVHAIAIGIRPKFQQYGLETAMMMSSLESVRKAGFKTIELRWAGDFNPKVIRLHKAVGAYPIRKHVVFRKMFNETELAGGPAVIPMSRGSQP